MKHITLSILSLALGSLIHFSAVAHTHTPSIDSTLQWVAVQTPDKHARSKLVNLGVSIESVVDDMSYGFAPESIVQKIAPSGLKLTSSLPASAFKALDFPAADAPYHNYEEQLDKLNELKQKNPRLVHLFPIGLTLRSRSMMAIRLNSDVTDEEAPEIVSTRPGIVFMGGHHAREHLSVEIPLLLAEYLVDNYGKDPQVTDLLNKRDVFIIPNVNPDGSEFDIDSGSYKMWRKNTRVNGTNARCNGVDLNRNYGYGWGTGGSSKDPCSDIYMGPKPFSEPETRAIKAFVEARPNLKVLLSFHTFSELILYPWGGKNDPISNQADLATYKKMATTMAGWNGYTPEQASDLYIASGDTTDWSYGTLGIFSFTFELSPTNSGFGGAGFYPGVEAIQTTFQANIKPALYLIDLADDPHRAVKAPATTLFYSSQRL
jgi:carboxypeptidase T